MKQKKNSKAFTLAEVKSSRGTNEVRGELASTEVMNFRCKSERCRLTRDAGGRAFTLAEVLIALGIIGIVAAMTIPSLMQNINNKQLTTATNNFNRRFGEALRVMNSQGTLAGHKTTENFVNELSKVFKVAKVCDNTKLDQCFSKNITWGNEEIVNISQIKLAKDLVEDETDWKTDVMGVRFANGVSALIAYNPECKQDQGNNNLIKIIGDKDSIGFNTNDCLAMLYDVSSNKKPNKMGADIQRTSNVKNLSGVIAKVNGVKIARITLRADIKPIDCTDLESEDHKYCMGNTTYEQNYYAGTVKLCGGQGNLPSLDDLTNIARYMYNNDEITRKNSTNMSKDPNRVKELSSYGFPSDNFQVWGNVSYTDSALLWIYDDKPRSSDCLSGGNPNTIAVCVKK